MKKLLLFMVLALTINQISSISSSCCNNIYNQLSLDIANVGNSPGYAKPEKCNMTSYQQLLQDYQSFTGVAWPQQSGCPII